MIRAAYIIGRILAALGALLVVATVILTLVAFANATDCHEPDCDDDAREEALAWALILVPTSLLLGAAGVALVNDTYRKAE